MLSVCLLMVSFKQCTAIVIFMGTFNVSEELCKNPTVYHIPHSLKKIFLQVTVWQDSKCNKKYIFIVPF